MYLPHEQLDSFIQENVVYSEDEPGKSFCCALCQQSARFKQVIERHIESAHIETDPFNCNICGSSFRYSRYLRNHMKKEHK